MVWHCTASGWCRNVLLAVGSAAGRAIATCPPPREFFAAFPRVWDGLPVEFVTPEKALEGRFLNICLTGDAAATPLVPTPAPSSHTAVRDTSESDERAQAVLAKIKGLCPDCPELACTDASLLRPGGREKWGETLKKHLRDQIAGFDAAIDLEPLGDFFLTGEQYNKAISCYAAMLEYRPRTCKFLNNAALAFIRLDDARNALLLSHFSQSMKHSKQALLIQGIALKKMGYTEWACFAYQQVLQADPADATARIGYLACQDMCKKTQNKPLWGKLLLG